MACKKIENWSLPASPRRGKLGAVASSDGGKSWKPLFDLLFRPHKPG